MITVRDLLNRVDVDSCVDDLVQIHRNDFQSTGFVLSVTDTKRQYNDIVNDMLKSPRNFKNQHALTFHRNINDTLSIKVDGLDPDKKLMDPEHIMNSTIEIPKYITKEGAFLELLYEVFTNN
jgi:hypothetical protein